MYIKEFSKYKVVFSNGQVITCDKDKGQEFDYDTIKKILESGEKENSKVEENVR